MSSPLGITESVPRFSWKLSPAIAGTRNLSQSAYRIVVTNEGALNTNVVPLWDSGKVLSSASSQVKYAGKPLTSGSHVDWQVTVWDNAGMPLENGVTSNWSTGLFNPKDWKGTWIGYDAALDLKPKAPSFEKAHWIWHQSEKGNVPAEKRYFKRSFNLQGAKTATLLITADDQYNVKMNGKQVGKSDGQIDSWRRPGAYDVTSLIKDGDNSIEVTAENTKQGSSGLLVKLLADNKDVLHSDATWESSKDGTNWQPTTDLGAYGANPWGIFDSGDTILPPPRYLRKEFQTSSQIKRATLYASALGIYKTYINGNPIGKDYFAPGWTDYEKRVYANCYDVTKQVKLGSNAIGAVLADGWHSGYVGYGHHRDHYGSKTRYRAQLVVEYQNGQVGLIPTDDTWKASTGGLLEADFLMGEVLDQTKEPEGWTKPGFNDKAWDRAQSGADKSPQIQGYPSQPVQAYKELRPKTITEPIKGVYILNLGQNMAGFARLRLDSEPGQKVTLRFAERLNPDGTIYTTNLRSARATDSIVCKGGKVDWSPSFTFHGFQYIEVAGLKNWPKQDTVVGVAISSATPVVGNIQTSDPMLNQLFNNIYWTQRMNFIDIPTDCPQRDERLGWTGDAQTYVATATRITDVESFFTKWLVDLEDAQRSDGQFPMVAPLKVAGGDGGPAWADAGIICPWTIYQAYGDKTVLERHYNSMKKFLEFTINRSTADLLPPKDFHCFGDWVSINADTPREVIFEAYFAYCTDLMRQIAKVLGKSDDEAKFANLRERIKTAFNKVFVTPEGIVRGDTQCSYVLALANDLLDEPQRSMAASRLVGDIEKKGWHLSTGFVGTKDLMLTLSKINRQDVAYRLLHNETFPSWGFSIKNGATSIWERWNGWTPESGFADPGMNSFAHYSFGAVGQWMFENIGGIKSETAGYETVSIKPVLDGKIKSATVSYNSIRGPISVDWKLDSGKFSMKVIVPPNTKATIWVPGTITSFPVRSMLTFLTDKGYQGQTVGSGEYFYTSKL